MKELLKRLLSAYNAEYEKGFFLYIGETRVPIKLEILEDGVYKELEGGPKKILTSLENREWRLKGILYRTESAYDDVHFICTGIKFKDEEDLRKKLEKEEKKAKKEKANPASHTDII